jgi:hypothetical protein
MDVQVFERPYAAPVSTRKETDVRINYNGQWIDFRNGKIIITPESK